MIITKSEWLPEEKLVITQISGEADMAAIEAWDRSLQEALSRIEENGTFKILVNLHGFQAVNLAAHQRFRTVIPATLANYGWKAGYVNLFEEAANMQLTRTRGIACVAAVHVHQDQSKIEKYDAMFGKETERFFTDPALGYSWIRQIVL
ncbi:MAG: hypothetical protein ICV83_14920 [Cytophagales bacterium]|nr:hypothetical protein [Cytophagales bacterium]